MVTAITRVSRNAPCPCGSGRKHKLCCLPAETGGVGAKATVQEIETIDATGHGCNWRTSNGWDPMYLALGACHPRFTPPGVRGSRHGGLLRSPSVSAAVRPGTASRYGPNQTIERYGYSFESASELRAIPLLWFTTSSM